MKVEKREERREEIFKQKEVKSLILTSSYEFIISGQVTTMGFADCHD